MKKRLGLVVVSAFLFLTLLIPAGVSAQASGTCAAEGSSSLLGFPTWYKYLQAEGPDCTISITIPDDAGKILAAVFEILLRVAGIVAVIFVLYGSIQYIISQGEPENLKNARTTIINALIGLVITIFATGIVNLVAGRIT